MIFPWSLWGSKSLLISRILLTILADLYNVVFWMVSIRPSVSNSSSLLTKFFETVPSAPLTISITVTFMLHSIFSSLAKSKNLWLFSFYLIFIHWSAVTTRSTLRQVLVFFSFFFLFFFFFVNYHKLWSSCRDYYCYDKSFESFSHHR